MTSIPAFVFGLLLPASESAFVCVEVMIGFALQLAELAIMACLLLAHVAPEYTPYCTASEPNSSACRAQQHNPWTKIAYKTSWQWFARRSTTSFESGPGSPALWAQEQQLPVWASD